MTQVQDIRAQAFADPVSETTEQQRPAQNISDAEKKVSIAAGAIAALMGLGRRDLLGLGIAAVGGALIYRGISGHCGLYEKLGIDTHAEEEAEPETDRTVRVADSFLVNRTPEELYGFWRQLSNLPQIMTHLESVAVIDERRSHWVARMPKLAGGKYEWDAEITTDEPNHRIAWRSVEGSDVDNRGEVHFSAAPGDRGTKVSVVIEYVPPMGALGGWITKLLGETPRRQIRDDIRHLKQLMETGELPTTDGQSRGTCTGRGKRQTN